MIGQHGNTSNSGQSTADLPRRKKFTASHPIYIGLTSEGVTQTTGAHGLEKKGSRNMKRLMHCPADNRDAKETREQKVNGNTQGPSSRFASTPATSSRWGRTSLVAQMQAQRKNMNASLQANVDAVPTLSQRPGVPLMPGVSHVAARYAHKNEKTPTPKLSLHNGRRTAMSSLSFTIGLPTAATKGTATKNDCGGGFFLTPRPFS